ncbi:MAG: YbjQ family protein [Planctomycetota bacterium]|nr:MAG: YbjQ family protein [Planctomycetota bacterium]
MSTGSWSSTGGAHPQSSLLTNPMVTTGLEIPGYRVVRNLGVVRGVTVRSRSVVGNIGASLQTLFGGNISILTNLCEHARAEAFDLMIQHATQMGANAIVAARYDATEIMNGATEVLAYGTAVIVEPTNGGSSVA